MRMIYLTSVWYSEIKETKVIVLLSQTFLTMREHKKNFFLNNLISYIVIYSLNYMGEERIFKDIFGGILGDTVNKNQYVVFNILPTL